MATKETCKQFLKHYRKIVGAKKDERIDKRYKPYLAPDNNYYDAHCGYCAEVEYLGTLQKVRAKALASVKKEVGE